MLNSINSLNHGFNKELRRQPPSAQQPLDRPLPFAGRLAGPPARLCPGVSKIYETGTKQADHERSQVCFSPLQEDPYDSPESGLCNHIGCNQVGLGMMVRW